MESKIAGISTVCVTACSDQEQRNHQSFRLLAHYVGNPLVNSSSKITSNAESISISWCLNGKSGPSRKSTAWCFNSTQPLPSWWYFHIVTSSNGNIFRITGPLCGESTSECPPHKGQWRWAFMFSLICAWINSWVNTREAGDLRRHCAHHDVTVMYQERAQHDASNSTHPLPSWWYFHIMTSGPLVGEFTDHIPYACDDVTMDCTLQTCEKWCPNSLVINFVHCDIDSQSCKKNIFCISKVRFYLNFVCGIVAKLLHHTDSK